jgi:nicotinamide-nucleotide amidase
VLNLLDGQGLTLAVVEAGTGGSLFNTLTAGNSAALLGGLTLQRPTSLNLADEVLRMEVHDLATAAGAAIMATKARDIFGATVGMGITVAPSPEPGQPGTLFFAIDVRGRMSEEERRFRATPAELRRRAALFGAEILRSQLLLANSLAMTVACGPRSPRLHRRHLRRPPAPGCCCGAQARPLAAAAYIDRCSRRRARVAEGPGWLC